MRRWNAAVLGLMVCLSSGALLLLGAMDAPPTDAAKATGTRHSEHPRAEVTVPAPLSSIAAAHSVPMRQRESVDFLLSSSMLVRQSLENPDQPPVWPEP